VDEDWELDNPDPAGDKFLTLEDAQALGPAFFAAFPHLVYAGPPEDRLGSVPKPVVAWLQA
jgi:hypothetical protein